MKIELNEADIVALKARQLEFFDLWNVYNDKRLKATLEALPDDIPPYIRAKMNAARERFELENGSPTFTLFGE